MRLQGRGEVQDVKFHPSSRWMVREYPQLRLLPPTVGWWMLRCASKGFISFGLSFASSRKMDAHLLLDSGVGDVLSMFHARDLFLAALFDKSDPIESSIGLRQIYPGV